MALYAGGTASGHLPPVRSRVQQRGQGPVPGWHWSEQPSQGQHTLRLPQSVHRRACTVTVTQCEAQYVEPYVVVCVC